jgi:hypothetical protein
MKKYLICIRPANAPAWRYTGLFAHSVDAILHALDATQGQPARISAKVLA